MDNIYVTNKQYTMKDLTQFTYEIIECENKHLKIEELLEQYANQKVIDELEALKLCNGVGIDLEITIDEIIKELKQ